MKRLPGFCLDAKAQLAPFSPGALEPFERFDEEAEA